jgi:polyferredoxin
MELEDKNMKKSQVIMVWLLPLIVVVGLFVPVLGYLVAAMIAFFSVFSFFNGRFWCWNFCPRGAFLDIVISKVSLNKPVPTIFTNQHFRLALFVSFMIFAIFRLIRGQGDLIVVGTVFVGMCLFTTAISILLGILTKHRAWCTICPMGFLQEKIHGFNK